MRVNRILAPNPGPFTGPGTNTYLLSSAGQVLVIDPGPVSEQHLEAIRQGVRPLEPVGVAVTHTHGDHAPLANPLARELGVPAFGFAPGPDFRPDVELSEGSGVSVGDLEVIALHTPGHSADHLCYLAGDVLFTGDHVLGGSTTVVVDMAAYLSSLRRLTELEPARVHPGHGPELDRPGEILLYYLQHRLEREAQVLEAALGGASTVGEVVEVVYRDVDPDLWPLATVSVAAHLRKLADEGRVSFSRLEVSVESADELWDEAVATQER